MDKKGINRPPVLVWSFVFLTVISFLIAVVWLAILGEWYRISVSIALSLLFYVGSFFLLSKWMSTPAVCRATDGNLFSRLSMYILCPANCLWVYLVSTIWIVYSFDTLVIRPIVELSFMELFIPRLDLKIINDEILTFRSIHPNVWPYLLLAFAVATAPWSYFIARVKNFNDRFTQSLLVYLYTAALLNIATIGFTDLGIVGITMVFLGVLLVGWLNGMVVGAYSYSDGRSTNT